MQASAQVTGLCQRQRPGEQWLAQLQAAGARPGRPSRTELRLPMRRVPCHLPLAAMRETLVDGFMPAARQAEALPLIGMGPCTDPAAHQVSAEGAPVGALKPGFHYWAVISLSAAMRCSIFFCPGSNPERSMLKRCLMLGYQGGPLPGK